MTDEVLTPVNPVLPPIRKTVTLRHTDSDTGKVEEYGFTASDADHPLVFEDGYLTGTLSGSFPSPYTGRIENYELLFNGLPIDGIGGGSGAGSNVEIVKITMGDPDPDDPSLPIPVQSVDKTWSELEAAVLAGKTIIANCSSTMMGKINKFNDVPFILQTIYDDTNLLHLDGENNVFESGYTDHVLFSRFVLSWNASEALPTLSVEEIGLQIYGGR